MGWERKHRTAAAVAVALAMAACSSEDNWPPKAERPDLSALTTTTTTPPPPQPMEVVWSTEGQRFASKPVVSGGLLVAFVADGGGISLAAYDPATGAEVWRHPSTASYITQGQPFGVTADDHRVFHIAPGDELGDDLIEGIDAATGDVLWRSEASPGGFGDAVDFCDETKANLCISAIAGRAEVDLWQLDLDSGAVTELPAPAGRALGTDLYDLTGGDIARIVDGQTVWQRSPSELFDGLPVDPDFGWGWLEQDGMLIGTFGAEMDWPENGTFEYQPEHTAGIDAATGETRWVADGDIFCGRARSATVEPEEADSIWVRCRTSGTTTVEDSEPTGYALQTVMDGFDPVTGATTWSVDLGASSALWDDTRLLVRLSTSRFAFAHDDGSLFGLDMVTGEVLGVTPDLVGWCTSDNHYDYSGPGYDRPLRVGEDFVAPCDMGGVAQAAPFEPDPGVGVVAGDVFVWMDEAGLHGARIAG